MKKKSEILIIFFLLTLLFLLLHNLFVGIFGEDEIFFLLALFFCGFSVFLGLFVFTIITFLSKKNIQKNRARDVNRAVFRKKESFGEKFADKITAGIGSWKFIIIQSVILLLWMALNVFAWTKSWDPYPFILLNLVLSFQAAYAAPIIMMSQNRTAARDRKKADWDLATDRRAERGINQIQKDFIRLERKISKVLKILEEKNGNNFGKKS